MRRVPLLTFAALLMTIGGGCSKDQFLYLQEEHAPQIISFKQNVKEIQGASAVDMLWVIDNSASMRKYQQDVVANTRVFMENFTQNNALAWKMGLISTDIGDDPYVGFDGGIQLQSNTADPVGVFQDAVNRLGTDGDGIEKTLSPILKALQEHPTFLRKGTVPLAVMIVTDAPEQSGIDFQAEFLPQFRAALGPTSKFFTYAVLNATDFGCPGEVGGDGPWRYAGDPFEAFVKSAAIGKVFGLCNSDFGKLMASIGGEIVEQVTHSTIYLNQRPKPATIIVSYQGKPLPSGDKTVGGVWTYDFDMNAIVFNDLAFATASTDSVEVTFQVDNGF